MAQIGRIVMEYNHFDQLAAKMPAAVGRIVWRSANRIRTNAMVSMQGVKGGRLYRRAAITKTYKFGGRGMRAWKGTGARATLVGGRVKITVGYKTHRASAPGEAPAIDLGNLRSSIFAEMIGRLTAIVGVSADYGIYLEYGTRRMAKRPFMRPAVEAERIGFVTAMQNLERELR